MDFVREIFKRDTAEHITATFSGGASAEYTMNSFSELIKEKDLESITSSVTGELYFYNGELFI